MQTYIEAWKLGLKAVAIYRDGSKRSAAAQHRSTGMGDKTDADAPPRPPRLAAVEERIVDRPVPAALPDDRHVASPTSSDRRPRGLHHRRPLRGRHARRTLHHDGQGRLAPSAA